MKAESTETTDIKSVKSHRYWRLNDALKRKGIRKTELAYELGLSCAAIAQRFSGITQWRLDEIYKILSMIGEKETRIHLYFPNVNERNDSI